MRLFSDRFTFSEHINELRRRLRVVAYTFLIILLILIIFPANPLQAVQNPGQYLGLTFIQNTVIADFLHRIVGDILPNPCLAGLPATPGCWQLIAANGIGEGMEIYFVAALILTLALDMPILAYETYRFIDPALKDKERAMIYPFVLSTSALFVVGLLFGYFVLAKFLIIALAPFFVATQITFQIDAGAFYYVVFLIIGATGVSFTSPVYVYALIRLRVLSADFFSKNRLIVWFVIWAVTGLFLTPDGGPLLDLVIFVPIVALIEIAVALGRRSVKGEPPVPKQEAKQKAKQDREIRCPSCGRVLDRPMLFCEHCGKSIA
ncbi:MAG TPA: twin-arginine translocase subunit TatC [Nitrososphaerales archaeon]|nr:twin-arginine translocase subunit TatC [Nitrososphaerales archaeon]